MPTSAEADQNENEKRGPADEERGHEPVAEFKDMIDLVTMLGGVGRLAQKFVDHPEANHTCLNLPRSVPDAARAAFVRGAKDEN